MAVSQSQIVDLLYKQAFGVTKTDTATNKSPSNESIPSPLLNRGDTQWTQSDQIPDPASAVSGIVQAYTGANAVECTADNTTVPIGGIYPTWETGLTYWIPAEFGATYNIQIWVDSPGVADPTSTGTQIFADGSGGSGQWYYNYQSGVLNFIGETIPSVLTSGKVIYVVGYRYIGLTGVTNLPNGTQIGNLSITNANISSVNTNANINLTPNGTGVVTSSANIYAPTFVGNVVGNISGNITIGGSNTQVIFNDSGLANGSANFTYNKVSSLLTVTGNLDITGTGSFGGNVDLNSNWINNLANPSVATDAATKQYVDDAVSAGLTIHTPVLVESPNTAGSLDATYADGGTTQTVTTITGNKTLQFSSSPALAVNDVIVFATTTNGLTAGTAYFVYSTNGSNQVTLSATYDGVEITSLTNGTGLSISSLANSGVGATLTSNVNELLIIDGVTMAGGERVLIYNQTNAYENGVYVVTDEGADDPGGSPWILTRSSDTDTYGPKNTDQLDIGDYFFVQSGDSGAGESYVVTAPNGVIIFGTTNITFTQFSASQVYSAGTGLTLTGTTFSINVAQPTITSVGTLTSLSVTGNIAGGNLTTGGEVVATGNVTGGNITTAGVVSATGNVSGGNLTTAGALSVTGNANVGNLGTGGLIVATGNVTGGNLVTGGALSVTGNANIGNIGTGGLLVAIGNITGGNLVTGGAVVATGNVSGANLNTTGNANIGTLIVTGTSNLNAISNVTITGGSNGQVIQTDGSGVLSFVTIDTWRIQNGTSNVSVPSVNGNVTISVAGNSNIATFTGTGANISGTLNVTGNATVGNLDTTGTITTTGTLNAASANITGTLTIGNSFTTAATVTTTAITANQTIASFSTTGITGVEYLVKGIDSSGTKYSVATVHAVTDGTTVDYAVFGGVTLGSTTGTLAVNISGGSIRLQVTPSSSNSTVWTTQYRLI